MFCVVKKEEYDYKKPLKREQKGNMLNHQKMSQGGRGKIWEV